MFVTQQDGEVIYVSTPLKPEDIKIPLKPEYIKMNIEIPQYRHICNLKLWLKDCEETANPWARWEWKTGSKWQQCDETIPMFFSDYEYRRKTLHYFINDSEIRLGLTHREYEEAKEAKSTIFFANITTPEWYSEFYAVNLNTYFQEKHIDHYIKLRLFYDNKEDAIHRAKHMSTWVVKE